MNLTQSLIEPNNTELSFDKNESSLVPPNGIELLGAPIFWIYQSLSAAEGVLSLVGNAIALIVVYRYEPLRENNGCRFIATLCWADLFGGIGIFISFARSIMKNVFNVYNSTMNSVCKVEVLIWSLSATGESQSRFASL